jgi:3-hydroxyisobutyrate dehydrogenase-like beta-hydroxyacid dehydrogenase
VTKVAVVGLGGMGSRIARRLADTGHELTVWNRTRSRAEALGLTVAATPADAAARAEVVITMLADPAALQAVTEGPDGVAAGAGGETALIEMSTVGPAAIGRLRGVFSGPLLDAPVLGSLSEVESGALSIFVGGEPELYERWESLLSALGKPLYVGRSGSGAAAKLIANTIRVDLIATLGEALALAEALGLARETAFEVLGRTPLADQAERRRPALEAGEFPPRFPLRLARKDADLIAEQGLDLRVTEAARSWLHEVADDDQDYSAVLLTILERATRP